jgi:hypothetical protein
VDYDICFREKICDVAHVVLEVDHRESRAEREFLRVLKMAHERVSIATDPVHWKTFTFSE